MSPEQARGEDIDRRSDLFSFGAVLYEMATGRLAFGGDTTAIMFEAILNRAPLAPARLNPAIPARLDEIINRLLEKDRKLRYQTASDLEADLRRLRRDTGSGQSKAAIPSKPARARRGKIWMLIGAVTAAAVVVAILMVPRRAPALTERDLVVLSDFVNTTGDPAFDGTLKQALAVQLEQSPFINIFSQDRVRESLRYMGKSPDEHITDLVAREICEREAIKAAIGGSIASIGSQYVVSLEAVNCRSGESIAHEQRQANAKEDVLKVLGASASSLRRNLGESIGSIQKFDAPIEKVTTSSLEAFRAYTLGVEQTSKGAMAEGIACYKRAVELDPNFAIAYARMATAYTNLGQTRLSRDAAQSAYDRRGRTSERERFYIETRYHAVVTGNTEKEIEIYSLWSRTYPRDFLARNNLAVAYYGIGQYDKALAEAQEALRLNPNSSQPYAVTGSSFVSLNRYAEARSILERAVAQKLDGGVIHPSLYNIAFVEGNLDAMQHEVDSSKGRSWEHGLLNLQAQRALFEGRFSESADLLEKAVALAQAANLPETAAGYIASHALACAITGQSRKARERAAASVAASRELGALTTAALAYAISGAPEAEKTISELEQRFGTESITKTVAIPVRRAYLEMQHGNTTRAIELLQPAIAYEPAFPALMYARGLAYLQAKNGTAAAKEFQKIIDHRGVSMVNIVYPMSHLGMARSAVLTGDLDKARRWYQDFFAIWKAADPDIPALIQARQEYAKLH